MVALVNQISLLRRRCLVNLLVLASCALPVCAHAAATSVQVWHSMQGASAQIFSEIVARFNQEQKDVQVELVAYTQPTDLVQSALQAKSEQQPHLIQVRDDLSGLVVRARAFKPLYQIQELAPSPDNQWFLPAATNFMRDSSGRLVAYPFAAQAPIMLYNMDLLKRAGVDTSSLPKSWRHLQGWLLKLRDTGLACPYTSSYPSWIHIENLSAWHNAPFASRANGLDAGAPQLTFNALLQVRHIALMNSWVNSELYIPTGDENQGDTKFAKQECAVLSTGSGALAELLQAKSFQVGIGMLPYYEEEAAQPFNTLMGGSAFWAIEGKKTADYKAVAQFLNYLSTPVIATQWHQRTGHLPLTEAVYLASQKTGFYQRWAGVEELMKKVVAPTTPYSRGIRLAHFEKVRATIHQELNEIWAQKKPPKKGLDDAVAAGNKWLSGLPEKTAAISKTNKSTKK